MRGRRINYRKRIADNIFNYVIKYEKEVFLSKQLSTPDGFIMYNANSLGTDYNYMVLNSMDNIKEHEEILKSMGITPSIYINYATEDKRIDNSYKIDFVDAWKTLTFRENKIVRNNSDIHIATSSDIKSYINIYEKGRNTESFTQSYRAFPWDLEFLNRQHSYTGDIKIQHYIAYLDGKEAGIAASTCYDGIAEIKDLTVMPKYRNQGVASRLINKAIDDLPGNTIPYIVTEQGTYADNWWEKQGFITIYNGVHYIKLK